MIYIVEDDNTIRELLVYTLNGQAMAARGFEKPSEFWAAFEENTPRMVILDIMLPEEDGLQVLRKLRDSEAGKKLPVMMLTAKGSEYDKVVGLDSGADDYIPKPFGMMELLARIKALLRRTNDVPETEKDYCIGNLRILPDEHRVIADGRDVQLTLKEYDLLSIMIKNPGVVFTRDQLLNQVWGYGFDGESRTVDVHIRTLRQKLGSCGEYISTVRGVGYKAGENRT